MSTVMTNKEFVEKLTHIAKNVKTLYVMGGIGYPLNAKGKQRAYNNSWNKDSNRVAFIEAASDDTFAFDCVCLIKSVLWGFVADPSKTYGGAVYKANGVPDIGANDMITKCSDISTDFSNIEVGEAVWMSGHIGVYIGDGLAVECTPKWANKVQITACNCSKSGYNRRNWTKHGKLPYIKYVATPPTTSTTVTKKTVEEIAKEVIAGKWGNGTARKTALTNAGYNYSEVQAKVNALLKSPTTSTTVNYQCVHKVVKGDTLWALAKKYLGNGSRYKEIMTLNGLKSTVITVGQQLKIPKK